MNTPIFILTGFLEFKNIEKRALACQSALGESRVIVNMMNIADHFIYQFEHLSVKIQLGNRQFGYTRINLLQTNLLTTYCSFVCLFI